VHLHYDVAEREVTTRESEGGVRALHTGSPR
jgi:hypothetical protein